LRQLRLGPLAASALLLGGGQLLSNPSKFRLLIPTATRWFFKLSADESRVEEWLNGALEIANVQQMQMDIETGVVRDEKGRFTVKPEERDEKLQALNALLGRVGVVIEPLQVAPAQTVYIDVDLNASEQQQQKAREEAGDRVREACGQGTGAFGAAAPTGGAFGAPSAFGASTGGAFGAPAAGAFGGGGAFGQASANSAPAFGVGGGYAFGGGAFGQPQASAPAFFFDFGASTGGAFGGANTFGANTGGAFGGGATAFGQKPAAPAFGQAPATGFGAPAQTGGFGAPANAFGAAPATGGFGAPAADGFGATTGGGLGAPAGGEFGGGGFSSTPAFGSPATGGGFGSFGATTGSFSPAFGGGAAAGQGQGTGAFGAAAGAFGSIWATTGKLFQKRPYPVTHVAWKDSGALVSSSGDGSTKCWDVSTGTSKDEVAGEQVASTAAGTEQRAGRFLVTAEGDLVLIHYADGGEGSGGEEAPVAFFLAPSPVCTVACAGELIGIGCKSGAVLALRATWLVEDESKDAARDHGPLK